MQHHKFIATKPRYKFGVAYAVPQTLCYLCHQHIAHRMTETVVDRLKAVEVNAQHGKFFATRIAGQHVDKTFGDGLAVGQPSQWVMARQKGDLRQGGTLFGDVFVQCHRNAIGQPCAHDLDGATVRGEPRPAPDAWIALRLLPVRPQWSIGFNLQRKSRGFDGFCRCADLCQCVWQAPQPDVMAIDQQQPVVCVKHAQAMRHGLQNTAQHGVFGSEPCRFICIFQRNAI